MKNEIAVGLIAVFLLTGIRPHAAACQTAIGTSLGSGLGQISGAGYQMASFIGHTVQGQTAGNEISADLGFWFVEADVDGGSAVSNESEVQHLEELPVSLELDAAYPNPVSTKARVRFGLPQIATVEITLFDALGRAVRQAVNDRRSAGWHLADIPAHDLPAGTYFLRLESDGQVRIRPIIVLH